MSALIQIYLDRLSILKYSGRKNNFEIFSNFIKVCLEFLKIIFVIITTAHWIACFFYFVRTFEINSNLTSVIFNCNLGLLFGSKYYVYRI